jgi:hypothetical protein
MKPEYKLKYAILAAHYENEGVPLPVLLTDQAVEDLWEECEPYDAQYEFREGEVVTEVACESSRHYESQSVATLTPDGTWVGWTYWFGGGKHGNPEEIDWIEYAYNLDCVEEEKLVVVRTFTKKAE